MATPRVSGSSSDTSSLPSGLSLLPSGSSSLPSGSSDSSSRSSGSFSRSSGSSSLSSAPSSLPLVPSTIPSGSSASLDASVASRDHPAGHSSEQSGTGPWGVPIPKVSMTETSGQTYGFDHKTAEDHYRRLGRESLKSFLGPMPVEDFLDTFLRRGSIDCSQQPPTARAFEEVPKKGSTEKRIYKPLTKALNFRSPTQLTTRCPAFTFWDTSVYPDLSGPGGTLGSVKPDICCYPDAFLDKVKAPQTDSSGRIADMGFVAFWFEIKATEGQDFFTDPPDDIRTEDRKLWSFVLRNHDSSSRANAVRDLGQAVNYATEACKRQHRHCCFSISMSGISARFIRWDRAGAIVSKRFDIHKRPELLCDFLWCFAHISDAERGYDLTVEPATTAQENLFHKKITAHILTQVDGELDTEQLGALLEEHSEKGSVTSIHLPKPEAPRASPNKGRRLLVSRPIVVPLSMAGRGTRTYWAYDEDNDKVVFLKDTWRYEAPEREGDVINDLHRHGVENVPRVVYHGDVPQVVEVRDATGEARIKYADVQVTETQGYWDADWVCGQSVTEVSKIVVTKRYHYRMVVDVAGYTLLRLRGTAELLHAAYDAFRALMQSHDKAKRLHRDITPGNIILLNPGLSLSPGISRKGYLVDWDLSRKQEDAGLRQESEVSATWQFLAYAICSSSYLHTGLPASLGPVRHTRYQELNVYKHTIKHDMESMLYVVLYCALLWCPHNADGALLRNILSGMFDFFQLTDDGRPTGGAGKLQNMQHRQWTSQLQWHSAAVQAWLTQVMDLHHPARPGFPFESLISDASRPEAVPQWTPDALDALWKKILESNGATLSCNDRCDNIQRFELHFKQRTPHSALPRPNQPTHASPPGPKRRAPWSDDEDTPQAKHPRYSPDVEAPEDQSTTSEGTGFDVPPSSTYSGPSEITVTGWSTSHSTGAEMY